MGKILLVVCECDTIENMYIPFSECAFFEVWRHHSPATLENWGALGAHNFGPWQYHYFNENSSVTYSL